MTYKQETIREYVFTDIVEDSLIGTDKENRYLVPCLDLGVEDLLGNEPVSFYAPNWDYQLINIVDYNPYYDENLGTDDPENIVLDDDILAILPIYGFVHSGVSISTGSYGCIWDSGQIGYAFITKDDAKKFGLDTDKNNLNRVIENVVETIDSIYQNDVYTIVREDLDPEGIVIDYECVSGYIGYDYAMQALKTDI